MSDSDILIIGAGISGLGASFALREKGLDPIVLEKEHTYGGLCSNFETLPGFRFDRFVHLSFAKDKRVISLFNRGAGNRVTTHVPNPFNRYHGKWIKHPAQNNLFPLEEEEKRRLIEDFRNRPSDIDWTSINNYERWLRVQYGNAFAENFPIPYTEKYWTTEARNLGTEWIGQRMYRPSLEEVIEGARSSDTPVTYYAKEMRYPEKGGFKSFLGYLVQGADIRYGENVMEIDIVGKELATSSGCKYRFSRLISSMPLPSLIRSMGKSVPEEISKAAGNLKCTSGYIVSIALKGTDIPQYLWWYVYDKDILPARVYSPSLKSSDNVPQGCSSLQLEVYCNRDRYSREELIDKSVNPLIKEGILKKEDILDIDIRFEPWANVIFDHDIYRSRKIVLDFVRSVGIEPIGRFGLWDYLWTDQALLSGLRLY